MKEWIKRVGSILRKRLYLLALIWLISLLIAYLIIHQPATMIRQALATLLLGDLAKGLASADWPMNLLSALVLTLRDGLAVAALVAVSGALGRLAIRDDSPFNEIERPVLQALLGLGVISLAMLLLGLLGLITPMPILIGSGLLGLILARSIWAWLRNMRQTLALAFAPTTSPFHGWLVRAALLLLFLSLLMALAPPTKWDALTYHLEAPRYYLEHGRVVSFLDNHFFGFPHLVEMLYLWLMIAARPQAAAALHWVFGVMALLLASGVAQHLERPAAGTMAMIIVLVCDSIWLEFGWPYNDLALMAYVTAALVALLSWDGGKENRALIQAGVFVGMSMSVKYTAASTAVGIGILTLWLARRRELRGMVVAGGIVSITALIAFSPWLAKNALLDGNPVSPFIWGTAKFDSLDQFYYLRPGTGLDTVSVLLAPLQGSVFGQEPLAPYGSSTGALIVALLPLAFIVAPRKDAAESHVLGALTALIIPSYLVWLAGAATSWYLTQTRLLYPIFPAIALVGAAGVERLTEARHPINLSAIARAAIGVALAFAVVASLAAFVIANTLPVTLGLQSESQFLEESLGTYHAAMQRVNELPTGSKIVLLWEPRVFYCRQTCVPDSLINQWWHDRQLERDPHRIAQGWREEGVTHVLISEDGLRFLVTVEPNEPLSDADVAALDELRATDLKLIWDGYSSYSLYELQAAP